MSELELVAGMLVQSKHKDLPLRSGAEWYPAAVVAQADPFVLISEQGDMMWTSARAEDFEVCGIASTFAKIKVNERIERIERAEHRIEPLTITNVERSIDWFESYGEKTVEVFVTKADAGRITSSTTIEEMYQMFKIRMNSERGPF
jgi:hypothetical protein